MGKDLINGKAGQTPAPRIEQANKKAFGMTAVARIDCRAEVAGSNRLPALAATISEHIDAANAATRRGLEHAIAAGALLIEAKELVAHGEWLPWLQANCRLSERTARTYMRLARERHRLESAVTADLTIAAAEALVGKPKPECPHGLPGQLDLLGGPEVPPSSATVPVACPVYGRAVVDLIADLEQILAFIRDEGQRARTANEEERYSRFRAADSTITTAIAFLLHRARLDQG
jgi:hypothetical protein